MLSRRPVLTSTLEPDSKNADAVFRVPAQLLSAMSKPVRPAVCVAPVSWLVLIVGKTTVASAVWPATETSQVLAVNRPLNVMVPVDAACAVDTPANTVIIDTARTNFFMGIILSILKIKTLFSQAI